MTIFSQQQMVLEFLNPCLWMFLIDEDDTMSVDVLALCVVWVPADMTSIF